MAAGQGFKTFNTGDVLSAADVNGYLMQGILVFASATARDAAITSPEEGQFAFLKDTNVTTYYTGSAWANVDTTGMTNPMTTTGDVIYSSSGSTPARLGIGTAGQVLTVNSGATAPEWAAAAGGGSPDYQLINAGGTALTGAATITVSGISGKNNLLIEVVGASAINALPYINIRFNGVSTNAYAYTFTGVTSGSSPFADSLTTSSIYLGRCGNSASDVLNGRMHVFGANASGIKPFNSIGAGAAGTSREAWNSNGYFGGAGAITSVSVLSDQGNFDAGTIYVYGA